MQIFFLIFLALFTTTDMNLLFPGEIGCDRQLILLFEIKKMKKTEKSRFFVSTIDEPQTPL